MFLRWVQGGDSGVPFTLNPARQRRLLSLNVIHSFK
jgi:hypothetical protein